MFTRAFSHSMYSKRTAGRGRSAARSICSRSVDPDALARVVAPLVARHLATLLGGVAEPFSTRKGHEPPEYRGRVGWAHENRVVILQAVSGVPWLRPMPGMHGEPADDRRRGEGREEGSQETQWLTPTFAKRHRDARPARSAARIRTQHQLWYVRIMPTGAFVMMDALGFKELSRTRPAELRTKMHGLFADYTRWLAEMKQGLMKDGFDFVPEILFLSDTIALGVPLMVVDEMRRPKETFAGEAISFAALLAADIVRAAGLNPLPMAYRGCISYGEYEMTDPFILGDAVNDAAEHYELAEAAAVWLTPKALDQWADYREFAHAGVAKSLCDYRVPLKSGGAFSTVVANPFGQAPMGLEMRQAWIRDLVRTFRGPMSVHIKRQNTAAMLEYFDSLLTSQAVGK